MKVKAILYVILGLFIISCSTDKEMQAEADTILGTWDLTALELDEGTATTDEEFGQQILSVLSASDCYLLTLTFNEDLSLETQDATNYLVIGVNSSGTGLEVPCPAERDTNTTMYTYAEGVLTFIDENQQTVSVNVSINGNIMVVSATELDVENFNSGGELIFTRR